MIIMHADGQKVVLEAVNVSHDAYMQAKVLWFNCGDYRNLQFPFTELENKMTGIKYYTLHPHWRML